MTNSPSTSPLSALLVHGFTGSPVNMDALRKCLEAQGVRCAVPVLAGHGTQPEDMAGTGWKLWQEDVRQAFDALRKESGPVAVVGLSLGGLLALDLAEQRPEEIPALVVLAP